MRFAIMTAVSLMAWGSLTTTMAQAAEQVNLVFGSDSSGGILVPVADLRTYAETGTASSNLQAILGLSSPEQQSQLRQALQATYPVNLQNLETVAKTESGLEILQSVAAVTLRPNTDGVAAVQTAMFKSAADPKGFNLVNFLEAYPDPVINLNISQMKVLLEANQKLLGQVAQELEAPGSSTTEITPTPAVITPPMTP